MEESEKDPMLAKHRRYSSSGPGVHEDEGRPEVVELKKCCGITVEPIVLLYLLGISSLRTTNEQFVYNRFLDKWGEKDMAELSSNGSDTCGDVTTTQEEAAQASTASFLIGYEIILVLPGILMAFWVGSRSDRSGRKLPLFLPVLGIFLRAVCSFLVAYFHLDTYYLFVGVALDGMSGAQCVLATTAYAYIADVTDPKSRSLRIFLLQTVGFIGQSIAQLTVGYLIFHAGWSLPYLVMSFVVALAFPFLCILPESVPQRNIIKAGGCGAYAKHTLRVLAKDGNRDHVIIRLLIAFVFISSISKEGLVSTFILYLLKAPICFNSIYIAYVGVSLWLGGSLVSFIALKILGRIGVRHLGNVMIGMVSSVFSKIYMFLPLSGIALAFGYNAIASLGMLVTSETRTLLSNLVTFEEQGAMSALVTVATLLGFNVGNSLLNATYGLTVGLYPETVFIIAIIVDIAGVILIGISMCRKKGNSTLEFDPECTTMDGSSQETDEF